MFGEEGLKKETIEELADLFQSYVKEDPFLRALDPRLVQYILQSANTTTDERPELSALLLPVLIQKRLIKLLLDRSKREDKGQFQQLLEIYSEQLQTRHADMVKRLREEVIAIYKDQHTAFEEEPRNLNCQKLALLLCKCRELEAEQLFEPNKERDYAGLRVEHIENFKEMERELSGTKLDGKRQELIHQMMGDLTNLLEIDTPLQRARSAQVLGEEWGKAIEERARGEGQVLLFAFPTWTSPEHKAGKLLISWLTTCRSAHLQHELSQKMELKELHNKIIAKLPNDLDRDPKDPFLRRLTATLFCYLSYSAKENLDGTDWQRLDAFDRELLNNFEVAPLGMSKAVEHLRLAVQKAERNGEGVNKQFDTDYIQSARRTASLHLLGEGKKEAHLVTRTGIYSGDWVLNALEEFAGSDDHLYGTLQACLAQSSASAFLLAAAPNGMADRIEGFSHRVEQKSEEQINLTLAAQIVIGDVKMSQKFSRWIPAAHQRVAVTFILKKQQNKWTVDEGLVKEREQIHWVTSIPELDPENEEIEKIDLEKLCENKLVYVERKSKLIKPEKVGSLYSTVQKLDAVKYNVKQLGMKGDDEALKEAGLGSEKWLRRMIEEGTGRKVEEFSLDDKRVISRDGEGLRVTKVGGGSVVFEGGEKFSFPYREIVSDGHRKLDPLFLTEAKLCWEV